jgi:uncharacterized membrane protein YccC
LLTNQQQTRALRYAVGITIATALASGVAWPLSFLLPVLSALFLALPLPKPTLAQGVRQMRDTLIAFGIGYLYTQFILPFPVIYVPMLGMALFYTYYHLNRGGSLWLVLMLLICLLLMPLLANIHEGLAIGVILGLVWSSWLTLGILWLSHYLVPDRHVAGQMPAKPGYQPGYSEIAAGRALKSALVVLPVGVLFIAGSWTNQTLVMLFTAIFTVSPDLEKGRVAGLNSLKSTLIGGSVAFFVYWLLVAVPEYLFLVMLMFVTSFGFGVAINSGRPIAKYLPSAMVALIVLVNSSFAEGADFSENFMVRMVLITLAVVYVVFALKVLNAFWPDKVTDSGLKADV